MNEMVRSKKGLGDLFNGENRERVGCLVWFVYPRHAVLVLIMVRMDNSLGVKADANPFGIRSGTW